MVRFGIVGFGLHAVKRLMPGFGGAQNCRVTALSRSSLDKAEQSAKAFGIPQFFDSAEGVCSSPDVDAVFVATPNSKHLADVLTAIRHKKPVLCEKPMGINAAQCREMVEAARKACVLLGVAQVFRFEESTARLRECIAAGKIGKPVFARSEFSFPAKANHPRLWLNDASVAGGGPIADIGVHCIDALRYILQDEVTSVSAFAKRDAESGSVEAAAAMNLQFARGTLASVQVSFRSEYRTTMEFVGESGSLRGENALNVERTLAIEHRDVWDVIETAAVSNRQAYALQVDAFAKAVEGGDKFPCPGEEGWQNQEIIDAAYRSIDSGRAEAVERVL